jgi:23S rRNA pseudouridine955/2504/2580 synthase/23S rRNA pseudouridine1911/1915/1917 synthase
MKTTHTQPYKKSRSHHHKPLASTPPRFEVLHEDDALLVLHKPSGLLVLPDRFNTTLPNVRTMLVERYGEIFIVHRIDRDTSGLLIVAKTAEAHKALSEQFEGRTVRKLYHGVVTGVVEQNELNIDIPLMPDPARKGLMAPSARGKESLTRLRVVERFRMATLVECELVTGRQHQIRVHCAAIGHPLLVDPDYGQAAAFRLSSIKRKYHLGKFVEEEQPLVSRTTLHAHSIEFQHPATGAVMRFETPYPKDLKALVQALRKYAPFRTAYALSGASLLDNVQFE